MKIFKDYKHGTKSIGGLEISKMRFRRIYKLDDLFWESTGIKTNKKGLNLFQGMAG